MKQATNKLFRGCPYKDVNFETCTECPNYQRCIKKKKMRTAKKIERFLGTTLPHILMAITLVVAIVAIIVCARSGKQRDPKDEKATTDSAEPTTATHYEEGKTTTDITEHSFVVVDLRVERPTTDSTEETSPNVFEETITVEEEQVVEAELSADGPSETYYYNLSADEKILIAKLVWVEARGECFEGKAGVAAVVINRYFYGKDQDFNRDSIEAVVMQPHQFASIKDVTMAELDAVPECMEAVEAVCKGWDPTREVFDEGALYFYAPKGVTGYQAKIREGIEVMSIGNHNFHVNFEKVR